VWSYRSWRAPLDDRQTFMKASHPPIPIDPQGLVALKFLSVAMIHWPGGGVAARVRMRSTMSSWFRALNRSTSAAWVAAICSMCGWPFTIPGLAVAPQMSSVGAPEPLLRSLSRTSRSRAPQARKLQQRFALENRLYSSFKKSMMAC
jgi:hypothetical protein